MLNFLQINLRKSGSARAVMEQTTRELQSDDLLLSKVPRGSPDSSRWVTSTNEKSAVALSTTARLAVTEFSRGLGFACMALSGLLVYSCY